MLRTCRLFRARTLPGLFALAVAAGHATAALAQDFRARSGSAVTLGARVQAQYEMSGRKDVASSFFIRRAWVTIDGSLNDFVGGRLQFDAQGATTLEAYLELTASPAFRVQLGQFKRGVSYFWLVANSDLPVIERDGRVTGVDDCPGVGGVCSFGQLTGSLGLDAYEPGVLFTGRVGDRWGYRLTVTNGEGISRKDVNNGKSTSARLSYFLGESGRLSLYGAIDETVGSRDKTLWMPTYGLEFETGTWRDGPHLLVNGLTGRNWKVSDDATFSAFQVMGLWYLPLKEGSRFAAIEPLFRFSWANTQQRDPGSVTGMVLTPGFMVYASGRNGISTNLDIYRSWEERIEWSLKVQAFTFF